MTMHPDPSPPSDLTAPRGGTIGPPPPLPANSWQMLMQAVANAAQQLAQASTVRPIFLQLMNDPVHAQAFTNAFQAALVAGDPALFLGAWPYQAQGPSPTAPKPTA